MYLCGCRNLRGLLTSDETYQTIEARARDLGKILVEINGFPRFASNRILMLMISEAIDTLYEGAACAEAIHTVMALSMHHPTGSLQLGDFIGLDASLAITEVLYDGLSDPKYWPCPLLHRMVAARLLGKKTR